MVVGELNIMYAPHPGHCPGQQHAFSFELHSKWHIERQLLQYFIPDQVVFTVNLWSCQYEKIISQQSWHNTFEVLFHLKVASVCRVCGEHKWESNMHQHHASYLGSMLHRCYEVLHKVHACILWSMVHRFIYLKILEAGWFINADSNIPHFVVGGVCFVVASRPLGHV